MGKPTLKVSSARMAGDVVIKTLVGDYIEKGTNHGRKAYQKMQRIAGHENVDVFLYYWDLRDGADFSGWWFGDQLGGSQVWAKAATHSTTPPKEGWQIPWDSKKAEPGALIVEPVSAAANSAQAGKAAGATQQAKAPQAGKGAAKEGNATAATSWQSRLKKQADAVKSAEATAKGVLTAAKKLIENKDAAESALKNSMDALQKHQTGANELIQTIQKELAEARKAGSSEANTVAELNKLATTMRTLQSTLSSDLFKVKGLHVKAQNEQKKKEEEKKQQAQGEKDARDFKAYIPKVKADTARSETEVEKLSTQAATLITSPPEPGEALNKQLEKIEASAEAAQKKLAEVRSDLGTKLTAARRYTGEAKNEAVKELASLQAKLGEVQKKLNKYKAFKKEYPACVAAHKALGEIVENLSAAEPQIEEVSNMCKGLDVGEMSQEEIDSADKLLSSALNALNSSMQTINQRTKGADPATLSELDVLRKRGAELRTKLDAVSAKQKGQKQALSVQSSLEAAREKVLHVESLLSKCQEAEMPFLKGIEVLPKEESDQAIGASEKAGAESFQALNQTRAFLKAKLGDAKKFTKEVADSMTDQLTPLVLRTEAAEAKIVSFRKETAERKLNAMLAETVDSIIAAEKAVEALLDIAKVLAADKVEDSSLETIKETIDKAKPAEKAAGAACTEARRILAAKQREPKGGDSVGALKKINERLNTANEKLGKQRQAVASAEKLAKLLEVHAKEEEKMAQAEAEVDKVEQAVPADEAEISEEAVKIIDEAMSSATKILKGISPAVQPHVAAAPPKAKSALQELLGRRTKAQAKLDKLKASTKDQRETTLGQAFLKDAETKAEAVESAIESTSDAELPFLRGIEILPLQEATDTVAASEKAAAAAQDVLSKARSFVASKSVDARAFGAAKAKVVIDGFDKITKRLNEAAQKLSEFNKDTATRKKDVQMQEASEKVRQLEEYAKNVAVAVEPFTAEDASDMSEEAAAAPLQTFLDADKAAKAHLAQTRAYLAERQRSSGGNAAHAETVKELLKRVNTAQADLDKAKRATGTHEARFRAKRIVMEVAEQVAGLETVLKTASDACAPLLEHGGEEFLVSTSIQVLATALGEHMKEKDLDEAAMFKKACGKNKKLSEAVFKQFVAGLPESIGREEVNFPEDRVSVIFQRIDADKDGAISSGEFKGLFSQRGVVKRGISVTDGFSIADSKTVGKVEPGDEVELTSVAKEDDSQMYRAACKLLKDGKECWVTVKGNQGAMYVQPVAPFDLFCAAMEKALKDGEAGVYKISGFVNTKLTECRASPTAAMRESKDEIAKFQPQVATAMAKIRELRSQIITGKTAFKTKEKAELNAHIEAKERKEAEAITGAATPKVESAEAATKAVENAAEPMTSLADDAVEAFATPASVLESVEKLVAEALEKTEDARKVVKEQLQVAIKVAPPTKASTAARSQLQKTLAQLDKSVRAAQQSAVIVKGKCEGLAEKFHTSASKALRDAAQKAGGGEKLFKEFAGKNRKVSEQNFTKLLQSLCGLDIKPEHAKLLCRKLESGGLSLRCFLSFVQLYYVVVKDVALTDAPDINASTTIRKIEKEELLEVLEGPISDEKFGLDRVRVHCVADGASGWVTVKGNQGTPFLNEIDKPFCVCRKEVGLEGDFNSGSSLVRTLKEDEILEVIEGPRDEVFRDVLRARVKTTKDNLQGWVSLCDKLGTTLAEANTKLYICRSSVAMTDAEDVRHSKVLRKLAADEMFEASGDLQEDTEAGIFRVCGKALKDGKQGWITTKGNAGTLYAEATSSYYCVQNKVDLQKRFQSDGAATDAVRSLEVGETFQVLEGPRHEKVTAESRVKVRAVSDNAMGWITKKSEVVKDWSSMYKCIVPTMVQDTRAVTETTKSIRMLVKGEVFELLDGPHEEGKELRIMGRSSKDGVIGWVTLRGEDRKPRLDC